MKEFFMAVELSSDFEVLDERFHLLAFSNVRVEKLYTGCRWAEGPAWFAAGRYLVWSDIPNDRMLRWDETDGSVSVFRQPAFNTNGHTVDREGRLVSCEHRGRCVSRTEHDGSRTVLASHFDGKRFNSPNDLVFHSSGDLFFTDPPYGLAKQMEDKEKDLPFQGVFRLDTKGKVHLLHDKMERPNGIGLSPDEKTLYVANSHAARPVIMAFDVKPDRSVANPRIFFNGAELLAKKPDLKGSFDGMAIDKQGNLFATGPGGVLILSPQGKHLGTILTGEATANCKFGGPDGRTLYITADMYLARLRTKARGNVPWAK
jgi:gluconolactonase